MDNQRFAGISKALETRGIRGLETAFDAKWVARVTQAFNADLPPVSITYKALLTFEGLEGIYPGTVEVCRDGNFIVRLEH